MSKLGWLARIGGYAAAPWTGGVSIGIGEGAARGIEGYQARDDGPASDSTGGGGFDWKDLILPGAIGAGTYAATRAFGGGDDDGKKPSEVPFLNELTKSSDANRAQGSNLAGMGSEALQPALAYLTQLAGGDPAALMDATRQDRGRVIDQYDTARRAISQFGPRGGGTTSALAESRFQQAESLADITSSARRDAVGNLAQLGPQLTALGLTANQLASQDLNSVINSILTREGFDVQKRGQNMEALSGLGEALGTIIGVILTRDKGTGAPT